MNNYERLTDKKDLNKPKCFNCEHNYSNCSICEYHCVDGNHFELREELQRLVQLEDKIENGELVEIQPLISYNEHLKKYEVLSYEIKIYVKEYCKTKAEAQAKLKGE